jgi:hypothetical protein
LAAIVLIVLATTHAARAGAQAAATLYVDGSSVGGACSDSRTAADAANPATPLCTISRGIALAPPGATVAVRAGTYAALSVSGTRSAPVTVAAFGSESVSLPTITINENASNLSFRGLHLTGGNTNSFGILDGAHDISLVGSDVRSSNQDAIFLHPGVGNVLLEGNTINSRPAGASGGGNGITLNSESNLPGSPAGATPDAPITNVTVRNNHFTAIGTDAIRPTNFVNFVVEGNDITGVNENGNHNDVFQSVFGGQNLIFRNNFIHDNVGQGLFIKDGQVTNAVVENNVFVHNKMNITVQTLETIGLTLVNNTVWDNDSNVWIRSGTRQAVVRNNLFQQMNVDSQSEGAANIDQDYNIIGPGGNWGPKGPHDVRGTPKFVNPAAEDYRLAPGSLGVDAGNGDYAPTYDKACRPRFDVPTVANIGAGNPPYVDMGALEQSPDSLASDTAAPFNPGCVGGGPPATASGPSATTTKATKCRLTIGKARRVGGSVRLRIVAMRSGTLKIGARVTWKSGKKARKADLRSRKMKFVVKKARTVKLKLGHRARSALTHKKTARLSLAFTGMSGHANGCQLSRSLKVQKH